MIKNFLIFLIFFCTIFASEEIDIKEQKDILNIKNVYTIQLYTAVNLSSTKRFANRLPKDIFKKSFIIKIGKYYVVRYDINSNFYEIKKNLKYIKNLGYSDAFIVKMKRSRFLNRIKLAKESKEVKTRRKKFTRNEITFILSEADRYFNENKYEKSLNEYLKIYRIGKHSDSVIINISYLMGKTKKYYEFSNFIKLIEKKEPLIYAFCIGVIEEKRIDIAKDILLKNLNFSEDGFLELLLGYIFEKENNTKIAFDFYEEAYKKNNNNPYFIYAYARSLDFLRKYKEALKYYKKILDFPDNKIVKLIKKRINQLEAIK